LVCAPIYDYSLASRRLQACVLAWIECVFWYGFNKESPNLEKAGVASEWEKKPALGVIYCQSNGLFQYHGFAFLPLPV
jgi:hypothetical protein